jgi:hypothetical protein
MSERKIDKKTIFSVAAWLGLCALGFAVVQRHQSAPGPAAKAPDLWPQESGLRAAVGRGTLLLFAHPRCPCTRASVDSLAWVLSRSRGRVAAYVVFYKPPEFAEPSASTALWRAASAIPGVTAVEDAGGREARRFGVATSGQALLFDAGGALLYRGGVTGARGHSGDNAGREALLALSVGRPALAAAAPVFGCLLLSSDETRRPGHG